MPLIFKLMLILFMGVVSGYIVRKYIGEKKIKSAEELATKIVTNAEHEAESKKKELLIEARDEIYKLRTEQEKESKERRAEIQKMEKRIISREELVDNKLESLDKKEEKLRNKLEDAKNKFEKAENLVIEREKELQKIAGLTADEGKKMLLEELEKEIKQESAVIIRENEQIVKDECNKHARNIIAQAIQRCAADQVAENTVSIVNLPNDDMKGRIIGREGRNIRSIEALTGVDLIIDDTPEAVVLSCFDPVRREVARIALEKLVADGRIHPTKIEESIEKAQNEVDVMIKESGEQAAYDCGIHGLHPDLIKYMGRLKYRTSYGQNVLKHSVEVANIAGLLADEIGADVNLAKRGGFLHDIGKSIDREIEGTHVELGVDLAKRYKESPKVINCIEAHHGDVEAQCIEAVLVIAADAISAARPGARREAIESYIKRLEKLEEIATSFEGIERSYAIQAGREVRIIVNPEKISETEITLIARDIVKKIETELQFPGKIKVNVIRETRAVKYAK